MLPFNLLLQSDDSINSIKDSFSLDAVLRSRMVLVKKNQILPVLKFKAAESARNLWLMRCLFY